MKRFFFLICFVTMLTGTLPAFSQGCAVCTSTASQLGDKSARGLNKGILFLAALPLTLIGTIGVIWYRRQRHS